MIYNPFRIEGPACVSFSGGRTSGYMLRRILDAHGGGLPADVHVAFANTGKERTETLDFVRDCGEAWGVRIRWVEYMADEPRWREVEHATASRAGEPFAALIARREFLPNPVTRFCTSELKIRPMKALARAVGFDHWTNVVGLRADEPRRVAKATAPNTKERWETECPLAVAGVTEADVLAFWRTQPFDLRLRSHEGNCDLCFLKGREKLERIIRAKPELADWWIEQEALALASKPSGARFRSDRPGYRSLLRMAPTMLPGLELEEDSLPCGCTD